MEENQIEIGGVVYSMKLFPTMVGLHITQKLFSEGYSPDVIFMVVSKGAQVGSVAIDQKKFDTHFRGKYAELMELFAAVLKFNNLVPEAEGGEGNESDSEA